MVCQPRGFCAGVDRAIQSMDRLVRATDEPVYVRKEIVHNRFVVAAFERRGVTFVDEVEDAPPGALLVFSAHGVAPDVRLRAQKRGQRTIDATCPLVTKVHREVHGFVREGFTVFLVGHAGHEEVEGTMGQVPGAVILVQDVRDACQVQVRDASRVAVVTQTTLSVSETQHIVNALKKRFPGLREPARSDICYATENRQQAVRRLAALCDAVVVVGSENSSNSRSLRTAAQECGTRAYLTDDEKAIDAAWLENVETLGITAGASSPESLVQRIVKRVQYLEPGFLAAEPFGIAEPAIVFRDPLELAAYVPS